MEPEIAELAVLFFVAVLMLLHISLSTGSERKLSEVIENLLNIMCLSKSAIQMVNELALMHAFLSVSAFFFGEWDALKMRSNDLLLIRQREQREIRNSARLACVIPIDSQPQSFQLASPSPLSGLSTELNPEMPQCQGRRWKRKERIESNDRNESNFEISR